MQEVLQNSAVRSMSFTRLIMRGQEGAGILRFALNDTKHRAEALSVTHLGSSVVGGASARVEKNPGSLGFARDDTRSGRRKELQCGHCDGSQNPHLSRDSP